MKTKSLKVITRRVVVNALTTKTHYFMLIQYLLMVQIPASYCYIMINFPSKSSLAEQLVFSQATNHHKQ